MHIGIPLVVLLMMCIHVQRVPKRTTPAAPLSAGVLAADLLAAGCPVLSQGGAADLASAVPKTAASTGSICRASRCSTSGPSARCGRWWSPRARWLLALLPWLPRRSGRAAPAQFNRSGHPSGVTPLAVQRARRSSKPGLRQGLALPYRMPQWRLRRVHVHVLQGTVDRGIYQRSALPDAARGRTR